MNKDFSYIEKNITGGWEDNNYSFTFIFGENGGTNQAIYINKKLFPNTCAQGKFLIVEEVDCFSLEIFFFQDDTLINKMILKIEDLGNTILRIRSLSNEVINFAKAA
jgi:hypothetical protein